MLSLLYFNMLMPGVSPQQRSAAYTASLDLAEYADEHGFGQIVLSEHHGTDGGWLPSPLTLAGMMLARTKRLGITISALILPLHDPLRVAEDIAVLDLAFPGRLSVIAALGYRPEEYAAHGKDWDSRGALMDRAVETVLTAWDGAATPTPVTRPHPLLFVGGSSKPAVRRAARFGLPFYAGEHRPDLVAYYEEQCKAHGTTGFAMIPPAKVENVFVAPNVEAAWAELGEYFLHEARAYSGWQSAGMKSPVHSHAGTVEELRAEGIYCVRTPAECVAVAQAAGRHATTVLHPLCGGIPVERAWECVRLYVEQVLPELGT